MKPILPAKYRPPVPNKNPNQVTEGPTLISWKSIHRSPSPSPSNEVKERTSAANSTISPADTKETTGGGINMKERIAAFQGKGDPGLANPPPLPKTKKPVLRPPPKHVGSPSLTEGLPPAESKAVISSPHLDTESTQVPMKKATESAEQRGGGDRVKKDPEGEERTETTPRMQRLDGAKIRRAPPVLAPKPFIRRPGVPKETETIPSTY